MMDKVLFVEDHVVPQLFSTAIEAYKFKHRSSRGSKGLDKIETFGLLWGYSVPAKGGIPARVIATMSTVETSAVRHRDWVKPNFESILEKKEFLGKYWPDIELVGTFHSHPYDNLLDANDVRGWRASDGDFEFWPCVHEQVASEQSLLAHLVITVAKLSKNGWAVPDRLKGSERDKGYVLSAGSLKLWIRAYFSCIERSEDGSDLSGVGDLTIEIPALERRFF